MFCKHSVNGKSTWEVKDKTTLPSAFQQMAEVTKNARFGEAPASLFRTKVLVILVCNLCGKINKVVEEN